MSSSSTDISSSSQDLSSVEQEQANHYEELKKFAQTQRLNMAPVPRVFLTILAGSTYGFMSGFHGNFKLAGLRYLAQNAHRLPITKGGWYFYHKRKNYVVLKDALGGGIKGALKFGLGTTIYFATEASVDELRGGGENMDFLSTVTAATTLGIGYASIKIKGLRSKVLAVRNAVAFGLVIGLVQDGLRYARGNDIWYLPKHENSTIETTTDVKT